VFDPDSNFGGLLTSLDDVQCDLHILGREKHVAHSHPLPEF
jgi:hypothetical protein